MVAPEHCVPCIVLSHLGLPVKDDVLKLLEICPVPAHPFLIAHKVYLQVMEAEYHRKLPCIASCIFEAVFHGGAGHLAHCDDPRVSAEGGVIAFPSDTDGSWDRQCSIYVRRPVSSSS